MMTKVSSEGIKCLQCSDWALIGSVPPLCRRHSGVKNVSIRAVANGDTNLHEDKKKKDGAEQCRH